MKVTREIYEETGNYSLTFYVDGKTYNPILTPDEIEELKNNPHYGAAVDGYYTIRAMSDRLFIYSEGECIAEVSIKNIPRFFEVMQTVDKTINLTVDTDSFRKRDTNNVNLNQSWVEIGKWIDKQAIRNILNARKLGLHKELKPLLSRQIGRAYVYQDGDSMGLSFYFDGRYPNMCGHNGGIICHNAGQKTFSVSIDERQKTGKPYYSIHT